MSSSWFSLSLKLDRSFTVGGIWHFFAERVCFSGNLNRWVEGSVPDTPNAQEMRTELLQHVYSLTLLILLFLWKQLSLKSTPVKAMSGQNVIKRVQDRAERMNPFPVSQQFFIVRWWVEGHSNHCRECTFWGFLPAKSLITLTKIG